MNEKTKTPPKTSIQKRRWNNLATIPSPRRFLRRLRFPRFGQNTNDDRPRRSERDFRSTGEEVTRPGEKRSVRIRRGNLSPHVSAPSESETSPNEISRRQRARLFFDFKGTNYHRRGCFKIRPNSGGGPHPSPVTISHHRPPPAVYDATRGTGDDKLISRTTTTTTTTGNYEKVSTLRN